MCPLAKYPVLGSIFKPFRRSQQKTLALIVSAIAEAGTCAALALAAHIAAQRDVQITSALRQLQRVLANPRIRMYALTVSMLRLLAQGAAQPGRAHRREDGPHNNARLLDRLLIALDWTEWGTEEKSLLVAAAIVGARAIPVRAAAYFGASELALSRNARENCFVARLVRAIRDAGTRTILLGDRGFRRVSLLAHLQRLEQPFVVRLAKNVWVELDRAGAADTTVGSAGSAGSARGISGCLREQPLAPGMALDLGRVQVRKDRAVELRVVGVWATGQKEPWWLVTNLFDASLEDLAALYDRRMGVEEQFRDINGCRFGAQLKWTQIQTPRYLSRLLLLVGVAAMLWTAVGVAITAERPTAQARVKGRGARLSLLKLGIYFLTALRRRRRLGIRFIQHHLPPPQLRLFPWLRVAPS